MKKISIVPALIACLTFAPATFAGEWRTLAGMEGGRSHLSATAIGSEIFAAGGSGLLAPLNTFEVYDTRYDYWRPLPSLPYAREQFSLTSLGGEAYLIGGFGLEGRQTPEPSVWVFAATVSSWREGPEMPLALARHAAVSHEGSVFVFGGVEETGAPSDRVFKLSGTGSGWTELSARMPEALADIAVAEVDGKIYVMGGRRENGEVTSRVDVFDLATETWEAAAALPGPRAEHTAGTVGGRIHVAGGVAGNVYQTYADHFVFDPAARTWRTYEALPTPRHSLASAVVGDRWYVVGGGAGAGLFTEFTEADVLEVYDPGSSE